MGINVRLQDAPKQSEIITAKVKLEKDLRSCMKCNFFYGNNRQCPASRCIKEESKPETVEAVKESQCYGCPYRQSDKFCFPCMKKILTG